LPLIFRAVRCTVPPPASHCTQRSSARSERGTPSEFAAIEDRTSDELRVHHRKGGRVSGCSIEWLTVWPYLRCKTVASRRFETSRQRAVLSFDHRQSIRPPHCSGCLRRTAPLKQSTARRISGLQQWRRRSNFWHPAPSATLASSEKRRITVADPPYAPCHPCGGARLRGAAGPNRIDSSTSSAKGTDK
jgi:hypothetical protein